MHRHPAMLAEAVMRRLGEREIVSDIAIVRHLIVESILTEKNKYFSVDLDRRLAPRMVLRRAWIFQRSLAQPLVNLFRGHVSSANPIILYKRRAPTFASHSVSPGATSQRSRPTMRFFARRIARSSPIASF